MNPQCFSKNIKNMDFFLTNFPIFFFSLKNTCFLQVNIGAKTQCLSKEIGVGVAIPCWRMSQLDR